MPKERKLGVFGDLPQEIFDRITKLLSPLSRLESKRAMVHIGIGMNLHPEQEKAARVWNKIFQDEKWLNAVMSTTYEHYVSSPVPVLIGHDILKLYEGSNDKIYLVLTANDWGGDVQYAKEKVLGSLRPHSYDDESHEVNIEGTNITIALERYYLEELELKEPQRLFYMAGHFESEPETAALYYNEDKPIKIGTDEIGGIRDNNRLLVQDLSTIMSKFRDGKPLMRIISKRGGTPARDMIPRREAVAVKDKGGKRERLFWEIVS